MSDDVDRFLPLRPVEFHILLSLSEGVRHGYRIIQDSAERSGEAVISDVATLYRALKRMVDQQLIEPAEPPGQDRRRSHYCITPLGRRVAAAESARMAALLRSAKAAGLLPG